MSDLSHPNGAADKLINEYEHDHVTRSRMPITVYKRQPVLQQAIPIKSCSCNNLSLALVDLGLLLQNGEAHTLALGQGNYRGVLSTNHKHVVLSGDKGVLSSVLQLNDIERTLVLLPLGHDANTPARTDRLVATTLCIIMRPKKSAQYCPKKVCAGHPRDKICGTIGEQILNNLFITSLYIQALLNASSRYE